MGKFKFPPLTPFSFSDCRCGRAGWVVPAGQYQMAMNAALGKEVPIAGTYAHVAAHPQGIISVLMAPSPGCTIPSLARRERSTWHCLF
jgi:hypothetical protein